MGDVLPAPGRTLAGAGPREALVVGLSGIVIGSLVALFGVRVFFLLLPAWGFLAGFALGAQGSREPSRRGVPRTVLGRAAGLAVGVLFAILAGLWFWVSALIPTGVLTSVGGAAFAVTGALVVPGRVELGGLDGGVVAAMRSYPLALLAWLGLASDERAPA